MTTAPPLDLLLRQKRPIMHPSIQVFVWHPRDWSLVEVTLR